MDKILINENRQAAENIIRQLTAQGKEITSLVNLWNSQPCLRQIETAGVCSQFLKEPMSFLDSCVLEDTEIAFKNNKPNPQQVAKLFSIQYDAIIQKMDSCQLNSFRRDLFLFDEKTKEILLSEKGKQQLYEESKIYLTDGREVELYGEVMAFCETLNNYVELFDIDSISRNQAAPALNLKAVPKGRKWVFSPDISIIRNTVQKARLIENNN